MKEPLLICAINIEHFLKGFPKHVTIELFDLVKRVSNQKDIENILKKCDDTGHINVWKNGQPKLFFQVKQILYHGRWERFEKYNPNGLSSRSAEVHNYIMPFEQFQKMGRPKEIYLDFRNSVSLEEYSSSPQHALN